MKTTDLIKALVSVKLDLIHAGMDDAAAQLTEVIEELERVCTA